MRIKRKKSINILTILASILTILLALSTFLYYSYNDNIAGKLNDSKTLILKKETPIRTGPNETYPFLQILSSGIAVEKQSELGEWFEIKTNDNIVGWIPGWNISESNIKSPEEKMKEKLKDYSVFINPINMDLDKDFNFIYANKIKDNLEKDKIKVILSRNEKEKLEASKIGNIIKENKFDLILNIDVTVNKHITGPEIYFSNNSSQIAGKYIEKSLVNNYIMKSQIAQNNNSIFKSNDKIAEVLVTLGNINNKVDFNILSKDIYINQYSNAIFLGIKEYFYYLMRIEDYNDRRREQLINMPHKGLNIPFYYTKQDEFKNIKYGLDNNQKISQNGDIIISLAMINSYFEPNSKITVSNIVDWAGNKYYQKGIGTKDSIIKDFAENYNYSVEEIEENKSEEIEKSLNENKPVLIKLKSGLFGNKITYKVIRGKEDEKYYINDPDDDDVKLNNYNGFNEKEIDSIILKCWSFSK